MIRTMVAADLPQVQHLWHQAIEGTHPALPDCYWDARVPRLLARDTPPIRGLVYYAPGSCRIDGFAMLAANDELQALFIVPHARGCGAGNALMARVKEERSSLCVAVLEENLVGRYFLQQHGFVERERTPCPAAGQAEILMQFSGYG